MAEICQNDCVEAVINRSGASVCSHKIAIARVLATETKQCISWRIVSSQDRDANPTKSRMAIKLAAVVHRAIVRRPIQLPFRDMHLASEECIAAPVSNVSIADLVAPLTAGPFAICIKFQTARDNDSRSVSGIKKVCRFSVGTWRGVPVISCVIANCTANDGFKRSTSASAPAGAGNDNFRVGCSGIVHSVTSRTQERANRCSNGDFGLTAEARVEIPFRIEILLLQEGHNMNGP